MSSVMSDKLKETLGILEKNGVELKSVESTIEEYIDPDTGEVVGHQMEQTTAMVPFVTRQVPSAIPETEKSDIIDDYKTARNVTHTLIDMAGSALSGALQVATESQHPKAYTVVNELAATMRLLARDLIEMQAIYKEVVAEKATAKPQVINGDVSQTNINVTPGANASLADILKMVKEMEKQSLIVDAETVEVKDAD